MRHVPTGIEAKSATKSQHQNRKLAREILEARVVDFYQAKAQAERDQRRDKSRGSGMRGDKVRTYRERDDVVTDHRSDVKLRLREVRAGLIEKFYFSRKVI